MMIASGSAQQTTATNYDGSDFTRNGTDENLPSAGCILSLKTSSATPPDWTAVPSMSSQTSTAYTVGFTPDASSTIYGVAVVKDSATPSAAQIKAGQNGSGATAKASANKAVTGADTLVLTPSDSPAFPIYDLYFVLNNAGGDSSVQSLLDELLDAPTGMQRVTIDVPWGGTEESVLENASPAAVDGDILECSTVTSPGGYAVEMDADGVFSFNPGTDTDRQSIVAKFYDVSVGAWSDDPADTFYVNNKFPVYTSAVTSFLFRKSTAITPVPLEPFWADEESDAITVTFEDTLPTGLSNSSETLQGTPTVYGRTVVTERATDALGDFTEEEITIEVGDFVADVDGLDFSAAAAAITAVASMSAVLFSSVSHPTIPAGDVISQEPEAGVLAPHDQQVLLVVSLGASVGWFTNSLNADYALRTNI
jgi:hypothetical protein